MSDLILEVIWNGSHQGSNADLLLGLNEVTIRKAFPTPKEPPPRNQKRINGLTQHQRYMRKYGEQVLARRRARYHATKGST